MSSRKPRKTVNAAASPNAALRPNTDGLKVGDRTVPSPAGVERSRTRRTRVPFGSYLEPELQKQFKAACVLRKIEMQDALDEASRAWLDRTA
ncbi:hypothetical protein [Streptomyces sp. MJP52]|uniref:hypothetical protein n=1 Tax=Streptomyces sp. MJP52 TaxID=2940555 RepID=UPI0024748A5A|nr:hypothetical protein [Streptomyces sp. MJP52]MDH6229252.1 hypothetical protein [Streptomyces sp. MJP52]